MIYEQAVIDFLAQPENLPVALEIARRVEKTKDVLQIQFWHMFRDDIQRRLQEADLTENWKVLLTPDNALLNQYAYFHIRYELGEPKPLYLDVTVEAGPPKWNCLLTFGLRWSQNQPVAPNQPALTELVQVMTDSGLALNSNQWWLMYVYMEHRLRDDTFLVRFASDPARTVEEIGSVVWSLFQIVSKPLAVVNQELFNMSI
jgi:hypothetical protein